MADIPILSIVIVHYNTWDYLRQCLQSIKMSSLSADQYEVLVIDNASSVDIAPLLDKEFPWVTFIQNTSNTGFSHANNEAIRESTGRYVLLLNPDTVVEKHTLKKMVAFMDGHSNVGAATCWLELTNGKLDDAAHRGFPTPWNAFCHFTGIANLFPQSLFFNGYHLGYQRLDTIHEVDSVCGAFLFVRREAGEDIKWLDEDYFWYGEDIDFCYRLKQKGWQVMFVPDVKTIHYKGVSSGIKEHSQKISTADLETKRRSTEARFSVMRIFYAKHYHQRYPRFVMMITMVGITLLEYLVKFIVIPAKAGIASKNDPNSRIT